jgi:hypothetical protein
MKKQKPNVATMRILLRNYQHNLCLPLPSWPIYVFDCSLVSFARSSISQYVYYHHSFVQAIYLASLKYPQYFHDFHSKAEKFLEIVKKKYSLVNLSECVSVIEINVKGKKSKEKSPICYQKHVSQLFSSCTVIYILNMH